MTAMHTAVVACLATLCVLPQETASKPERYAGILTAGPLTERPVPIDIGVDRVATEEMRGRLAAIFQEGGQVALLEAIKKEKPAGYVKLQNRERLLAGYAEQAARPDGGRRILLLCPRQPGDWELESGQGRTDYLFRIVALTLDADGRGTGMLFHTARVSFEKTGVELRGELSGQPTKILSIQKR
jgi:hypothetical protein